MFKGFECEKFEYVCKTQGKNTIALSSAMHFTAQSPQDESLLERAIFVESKIEDADNTFKLNFEIRVIYSFEEQKDIKDGQEMLQAYQEDAYSRVRDFVRNFLKSINQNEEIFPDISFE